MYIIFFLSSFLKIPKSTTVGPTIGQGPIVKLEQAKYAMEMVTGAADRQGSEDEGVVSGRLVDGRRDIDDRCCAC